MSAYTGGSVPLPNSSDFVISYEPRNMTSGTVIGWGWSESEYLEREEKRRQYLVEADKNFPLEGMSGVFDDSRRMSVWKTGADAADSLRFEMAHCTFCGDETFTLSVSDDYTDVNVCKFCLEKMFDTFYKEVCG